MIMITPLPGIVADQAGLGHAPVPRHRGRHPGRAGQLGAANTGGNLVIKQPWPAMSRTIWGDPERYSTPTGASIPGMLPHGRRRAPRRRRLLLAAGARGRRAERLGPPHRHDGGGERAGEPSGGGGGGGDRRQRPESTGQAIVAFVTPRGGFEPNDALTAELKEHVVRAIGALARPERIFLHRRAAQDAQRQDHAAAAARHRRGTRARRHDDAARPDHRRADQGAVRQLRRLSVRCLTPHAPASRV